MNAQASKRASGREHYFRHAERPAAMIALLERIAKDLERDPNTPGGAPGWELVGDVFYIDGEALPSVLRRAVQLLRGYLGMARAEERIAFDAYLAASFASYDGSQGSIAHFAQARANARRLLMLRRAEFRPDPEGDDVHVEDLLDVPVEIPTRLELVDGDEP